MVIIAKHVIVVLGYFSSFIAANTSPLRVIFLIDGSERVRRKMLVLN